MSRRRPFTVLVVDDEQDDLDILSHAFGRVVDGAIRAERGARGALAWLETFPALDELVVVTDLNMPVVDGCEFIAEVRAKFGVAPVMLVLSTSDRPSDIDRAYAAGANGYHAKPMGYHDTARMCEGIVQYWSSLARLPGPSSS